MMATKNKRVHPLQYLVVIVAILIAAVITREVKLFNEGLIGTPFILIVTIAALLGDYAAGILALVLTVPIHYYVDSPSGIRFDAVNIFKSLELLVTGIIICLLAWRVRRLRSDNSGLVAVASELKEVTRSLQSEAHGNKRKIDRLSNMNKKLQKLVTAFLEDDEYWDNRWGPR